MQCPFVNKQVHLFYYKNLIGIDFQQILSKYAKPIPENSRGNSVPVTQLEDTPLGDWELIKGYFGRLHVLLAFLSLTIVFLHIGFATPKVKVSLVRCGFDLPDSISELLFSAIVVLQVERVFKMAHQFLQARYWQCKYI